MNSFTTGNSDDSIYAINAFKKAQLHYAEYLIAENAEYGTDFRNAILGMEEFAKLGAGLLLSFDTVQDEQAFTGSNFDADDIATLAEDCGMKFIIITAKGKDGFSLYPTAYGEWDIRTSSCRDTILDELKEACEDHGLKFGLCFSQYDDWNAVGGFGNGEYTEQQHLAYCTSAEHQIAEMVEKYEPYILLYDSDADYGDEYSAIFKTGLKSYPQVIVNGFSGYAGDFSISYGNNLTDRAYSVCVLDSTADYNAFLRSVAYGQNCILKITLELDGSFPNNTSDLLNRAKAFAGLYGGFEGYSRVRYTSMPSWGYMIRNGNKIVCYIINQNNTTVVLDGVPKKNLVSVETFSENASYHFVSENMLSISNLSYDSGVGVVVLTYYVNPIINDVNYADGSLNACTFVEQQNAVFLSDHYVLTDTDISTEFVWCGGSGAYSPAISGNAADDTSVVNITIYDVETGDVADGLENGKRYRATVSVTGEYSFYGISFTADGSVADIPVSGVSINAATVNRGVETELEVDVFPYNATNKNYTLSCESDDITIVDGVRVLSSDSADGKYTITVTTEDGGHTDTCTIIITTGVEIIAFDSETATMYAGTSLDLNVGILPDNASNKNYHISCTSDKLRIIGNRVVADANAVGTYTLTATSDDGDKTDVLTLTVETPETAVVPVTGIVFSNGSMNVDAGTEISLAIDVYPATATNKGYIMSAESSYITTTGNTVTVAKNAPSGDYIITVTSDEGAFSDAYTLSVSAMTYSVESISFDNDSLSLNAGDTANFSVSIYPPYATNQKYTIAANSNDITISGNRIIVSDTADGDYSITATSKDGKKTATMKVTVSLYDYIFEADYLDGTGGEDTGIQLFSDENTNWTLFSSVQSSKNPSDDALSTLYQCVINTMPWAGVRVNADNSLVSNTSDSPAPMRFGFNRNTGYHFYSAETGTELGGQHETAGTHKHPILFSRNGDEYKLSIDGVNWANVTVDSFPSTDIENAYKVAELTVGYDYTRSGGKITSKKYRKLKTDYPVCVAWKRQSEYSFPALFEKYD